MAPGRRLSASRCNPALSAGCGIGTHSTWLRSRCRAEGGKNGQGEQQQSTQLAEEAKEKATEAAEGAMPHVSISHQSYISACVFVLHHLSCASVLHLAGVGSRLCHLINSSASFRGPFHATSSPLLLVPGGEKTLGFVGNLIMWTLLSVSLPSSWRHQCLPFDHQHCTICREN